ncbi:hypothetical protein [Serratia liquefaciens]|uniref:hypothetical protein n=1 Tax=Serratia liquefaciens TaxID=614 RepID=UPI0021577FEA|nr:hypothetical protein [Serratia liquefaciens]
MNTTNENNASSITLFRNLIADLQWYKLNEFQLCDLSAVAQESTEGLCHGLLYLAESLESGEQNSTDSRAQISAWLKASAHVIPALIELGEQANSHMLKIYENRVYPA